MDEKLSFEQSLKELDSIVKKLENPDASLDETMELYKRGVALAATCNKMLDEAEQQITMLSDQTEQMSAGDGE